MDCECESGRDCREFFIKIFKIRAGEVCRQRI